MSESLIISVSVLFLVVRYARFLLDKQEIFRRGYERGATDVKEAGAILKMTVIDERGDLSARYVVAIANKENWLLK